MAAEESSYFEPKNHAEKLLSNLAHCFNTEALADVVLVTEQKRISAHRYEINHSKLTPAHHYSSSYSYIATEPHSL